jgi:hypothetical protein
MTIEEFSKVCKIPYWGTCIEPHKSDCNEFLLSITRGETRGITQATTASIHFPAIDYFALFIGRCINSKHDHSHLCAPDLSILKSVVLKDIQFNMGAIVARHLHNNALVGDFFSGIYATRLAAHLGVPIKEMIHCCHLASLIMMLWNVTSSLRGTTHHSGTD